jgi:hypothetical protein
VVRLPRDITPGQAARRALLADLVIAIVVAVAVLSLTAGLGIAAVIALPTLLIVLAWIGIEALVRRARRRKAGATAGRKNRGLRTRRSEAARPRQPEGPPAAEDPSEL